MRKLLLGIFGSVVIALPQSVMATVGFAEWEVTTANGNFITHSDPYKDECGTCLMSKQRKTLASQVQWWRYYRRHVTGQAAEGYFLLDERTQSIQFWDSEAELEKAVALANIGKPVSQRMTRQDGWNATWIPIMRQMYCDKKNVERVLAEIPNQSEREAMRKKYKEQCQLLKSQLLPKNK
ncbi:hypothetical protein [Calothrix sp. 336/3]|uniref:hypothetical protein n=2 Tax=Calothrix sp. 336/3 TaxID=1337936 RepID=UPI0004E2D3C2|nr:hypothetical protein IJ00_26815 [Calothrix sp. 336/3]